MSAGGENDSVSSEEPLSSAAVHNWTITFLLGPPEPDGCIQPSTQAQQLCVQGSCLGGNAVSWDQVPSPPAHTHVRTFRGKAQPQVPQIVRKNETKMHRDKGMETLRFLLVTDYHTIGM